MVERTVVERTVVERTVVERTSGGKHLSRYNMSASRASEASKLCSLFDFGYVTVEQRD